MPQNFSNWDLFSSIHQSENYLQRPTLPAEHKGEKSEQVSDKGTPLFKERIDPIKQAFFSDQIYCWPEFTLTWKLSYILKEIESLDSPLL